MAFRVGQKVACVDAGPSKFSGCKTTVKAGNVYTVVRSWTIFDHPCVLLAEVMPAMGAEGFSALRFRPIVERKTDISIFTAMLNPSPEDLDGHILDEVMS